MTKPLRSENFSLFHDNLDDYTKEIIIEKFYEDGIEAVEDYVIKEDKIEFHLNGKRFLSVMSIAQHQDAHILGFLLSEAVIKSFDDVESIVISEDGLKVEVIANVSEEGYSNLFKEKTLTSGCCVGVTGNAEKIFDCAFINSDYKVHAKDILSNMKLFNTSSKSTSPHICPLDSRFIPTSITMLLSFIQSDCTIFALPTATISISAILVIC